MTPPRSPLGIAIVAAALAAPLCLIYLPALTYPFSSIDDAHYVAANPHVREGLSSRSLIWAFGSEMELWHPLTMLSLMTDATIADALGGATGATDRDLVLRGVCRTTNLLLHGINGVLVFLLARGLGFARSPATLISALFLLSPLRVEAVVWIPERKELLATAFGLLAILFFIRYARVADWRAYAASIACCLLSLMAKPMLVTMPGIVLLLSWWPLRRCGELRAASQALCEAIPFIALAGAFTALTVRTIGSAMATTETIGLGERIATALVAYASYVWLTAFPWPLAAMYPLRDSWPWWQVGLAATVIGGCTVAAVALHRRSPGTLFGWLWFLGTTLPVSGVFQNGVQAHADRYTYFPGIGLVVAAVSASIDVIGPRLGVSSRVGNALGGAVCLILAALSALQVSHWQTNEALWRHSAWAVRDNWYAIEQHAKELRAAGRMDEAAIQLERCYEGLPDKPLYAALLTTLAVERQDPAGAQRWHALATAAAPASFKALTALGVAELDLGNDAAAEACLRRALALRPDHVATQVNLGWACARQGRLAEAARQFEEALAIDPACKPALANLAHVRRLMADPAAPQPEDRRR
jgi:tetratricopeptide (TPR) repeat protein